MGKIISVVNNKGGVGKTTITVNLAHMPWPCKGKRVLIVDVDSQCNSTSFFNLAPAVLRFTSCLPRFMTKKPPKSNLNLASIPQRSVAASFRTLRRWPSSKPNSIRTSHTSSPSVNG